MKLQLCKLFKKFTKPHWHFWQKIETNCIFWLPVWLSCVLGLNYSLWSAHLSAKSLRMSVQDQHNVLFMLPFSWRIYASGSASDFCFIKHACTFAQNTLYSFPHYCPELLCSSFHSTSLARWIYSVYDLSSVLGFLKLEVRLFFLQLQGKGGICCHVPMSDLLFLIISIRTKGLISLGFDKRYRFQRCNALTLMVGSETQWITWRNRLSLSNEGPTYLPSKDTAEILELVAAEFQC